MRIAELSSQPRGGPIAAWAGVRAAARWGLPLAGAVLASAAVAAPASAVVRPGHVITAFPDRDMIVLEGDYSGQLTVELRRGGVLIGRTTGEASPGADGQGLELNHGVGTAEPGDCWEGVTPDVRGGDVVKVTEGTETDEMVIGDVAFTSAAPEETASGAVVVRGRAAGPGGAALPQSSLGTEVRHTGPVFRASGDLAFTSGADLDVTYAAPYTIVKDGPFSDAQRRQFVLDGAHMLTYTPVDNEVTIAELGEAGGPAPGCEAARAEANAVVASDSEFVNLTSGDLVLTGTAREGTTEVNGTLSDGTKTVPFTGVLTAGPGQKAWTATIPRAALETLVDGPLTAEAQYVATDGTIDGAPLRLVKDVVAPGKPTSTPAPGTYRSAQAISFDGEGSIHYTTNGGAPTPASSRATGQIHITATQTVKAVAVDAAGNESEVATLAYVIEAPEAPTSTPAAPSPLASPVAPALVATAPAAKAVVKPKTSPAQAAPAPKLRARTRVSVRTLRRRGLSATVAVPAGAGDLRVSLTRRSRVVATRVVRTSGAGSYVVRFRPSSVRRLAPGTYRLDARGASGRSAVTIRITR